MQSFGRAASPPPADGPGNILWLASYPKSGNTWLRALLTNYLRATQGPASINALIGRPIANDRHRFDELLGLASSDLTREETLRHRPLFHRLLAEELPRPTFVKTHHAYLRNGSGTLLFPPEATVGAVYVIRNPLDIAVSFAHQRQCSIDRMVGKMNDAASVLGSPRAGISPQLADALLSWSGHVSSWLDQDTTPVHVVRYEDLLADPVATFADVVRFAGFAPSHTRLRVAVDRAAFRCLRAQEEAVGFAEKASVKQPFFRVGGAGGWRAVLSRRQAWNLTVAHRALMARFAYLDA